MKTAGCDTGSDLLVTRDPCVVICKGMRISASQYAKTLVELSKGSSADASALAASFLGILVRKRDIRKWPAILRMSERRADEQAGKLSLLAETAGFLDEASKSEIGALAQRVFPGKGLRIRFEVQPELLGGVRISSDDEMLDATVRKRLRELEKILR